MELSRAQLAGYAVAAVLVLLAAWKLLGPDPGAGHSEAPPSVRIDGEEATRVRGGAGEKLYVHVAGAVRRPGLHRLRPDARVAAALDRAGGPTRRADLTGVNLAARVEDGQQIVVPRQGASPAAGETTTGPAAAGAAAAGGQVSLASATVEQLDALDGIGPTLARRIVEYRDAHGGFRSIGDLRGVEGIGEKRLESLRKGVRP